MLSRIYAVTLALLHETFHVTRRVHVDIPSLNKTSGNCNQQKIKLPFHETFIGQGLIGLTYRNLRIFTTLPPPPPFFPG
ncbi:hypothetical protein CEXT_617221 [Caerostris extrusa]|uniref:Secreted protein n=1 Tax=Caerostris extrusa TaxID=172846 RepID=A0AAV4XRX0_CAEEX|nr:hypothetical protein CEXT_617221 [Caerostris extrusa]